MVDIVQYLTQTRELSGCRNCYWCILQILIQPEIDYINCEYVLAVINVVNILQYEYVVPYMGAGLQIGARTQIVRGYQRIPKFSGD